MTERHLIVGPGLAPSGEGWTYREEPVGDVTMADVAGSLAWLLGVPAGPAWWEERRGWRP